MQKEKELTRLTDEVNAERRQLPWVKINKNYVFEGPNGKETLAEVSIKYGTFISTIIEFLVVALVMFLVIKAINKMKKKQEEAPAAPPEPSSTDRLLMEIRDSLKK